ncbi:kelch-like protein 10 isoform X2 [Ornithodoros turicata]|uniref:kelch-like protein 10 isoform X2 n=1 Tax=Ornithodoros turicata TaxID=34597 RepID=UPI003139BC09
MELSPRKAAAFQRHRRSGQLCDVQLRTMDGGLFPVHRLILAATCPPFRSLFKGSGGGDYSVARVSKDVMELLIDFAYGLPITDRLKATNVEKILAVSEKFQIPKLRKTCLAYMQSNLTYSNCVAMLHMARSKNYESLATAALRFIIVNFEMVSQRNSDLMDLSYEELHEVVRLDDLQVSDEMVVFRAIIRWVEYNIGARVPHLPELMAQVRFGLSRERCYDEVSQQLLVGGNSACADLLASLLHLVDQLGSVGGPGPRLLNPELLWLRPRVPRDVLFVIGGWSNGNAINLMETYDCRADRWLIFTGDRDVKPRAYHGVAVLDGAIYVVGGFDGTECYSSVLCLEPAEGRWHSRSCMHYQRCYVSVAALAGRLYAMGGYDGDRRTSSSEAYDPHSNQWTLVADMHEPRSDACAATAQGRVYIAGGFTGQEVLTSVEFYEPNTDSWTLVRPMLSPRSGVRVVAYHDTLMAIGGFNGSNRLATVEQYDLHRDKWQPAPSMSCPRSNFAVAVLDGSIYVIGGFNGTTTVQLVEKYHTEEKVWRRITNMNINRSALGACVVRDLPNSRKYSVLGTLE